MSRNFHSQFDRRLGGTAAEWPVKFENDATILTAIIISQILDSMRS